MTNTYPDKARPSASRLLRHLSVMTLVEGASLIALVLIAVPIKYALDFPLAVKLIGPIHGALFVWTMGVLLVSIIAGRLAISKGAGVFLAALIPFGGLWSHRLLDRELAQYEHKDPVK
jgi:integral membrane protein